MHGASSVSNVLLNTTMHVQFHLKKKNIIIPPNHVATPRGKTTRPDRTYKMFGRKFGLLNIN